MAQTKVKLISDGVIVQGNLHASHGITTAHIGEGSNLYYTDARVSSYLSTNGYATQTDIVAAITDSAPVTLDTLNELAAALGDDPNFATTTATSLGLKAPLASPSFTGNATFAGTIASNNIAVTNSGNGELSVTRTSGATVKSIAQSARGQIGTSSNHELQLITNATSRLTISTSGNATFAGDVQLGGTTPTLNFYKTSHADILANIKVESDTGTGGKLTIQTKRNGNTALDALVIYENQNTTFAGAVTIDSNLTINGPSTKFNTDGDSFFEILDAGTNACYLRAGASDEIYIGANNNYQLRLKTNKDVVMDNGGNLGIGTDSPSEKLSVVGGNIRLESTVAGNNGILIIYDSNTTQSGQIYGSSGDLKIYSPADVLFNQGGNVGIGTTSPGGLLTINGTGDAIRGESTNTGAGGAQIDLLHFTTSPADNDTFALINMGGYYTGTTSVYGTSIKSIWTDVSARDAALTFSTNNGGTLAERMRITSSGAIEIKGSSTTASAQAFITNDNSVLSIGSSVSGSVVKDISFNSPSPMMYIDGSTGNVGIGTNSPETQLSIGDYTDSTETITIATSSNGTGRINFYDNNNTEGGSIRVVGETGGSKMYFANRWNTDNDRVVFDLKNGNVGIGAPTLPPDFYTATGGGYAVLGVGQSSFLMSYKSDDSIELCQNTYVNTSGANNGVTASVPAARLTLVDGQFVFQALQTASNYSQTAQNVLTIANSGSIGMGANSASYRLRVKSDATVDNGIYLSAGTGSGNHSLYVEDKDGTAEFFAVRGDGEIRLNASNQGHTYARTGIRLGANASANNLDDYEEGTWTPSITAAGGNAATATYSTAYYTKVGRLVNANVYIHTININAITSGTYILLTGLPFTSLAYADFTSTYHVGGWSGGAIVGGYVQSGQSYAYFMRADGTEAQQTSTDITMTRIMINITYQTT